MTILICGPSRRGSPLHFSSLRLSFWNFFHRVIIYLCGSLWLQRPPHIPSFRFSTVSDFFFHFSASVCPCTGAPDGYVKGKRYIPVPEMLLNRNFVDLRLCNVRSSSTSNWLKCKAVGAPTPRTAKIVQDAVACDGDTGLATVLRYQRSRSRIDSGSSGSQTATFRVQFPLASFLFSLQQLLYRAEIRFMTAL